MVAVETPEQVLSGPGRVQCQRRRANISLDACEKMYNESESRGFWHPCFGCSQMDRNGAKMAIKEPIMEESNTQNGESVAELKICNTCKRQVTKYKGVARQECASCSSRRHRQHKKEKLSLMDEAVIETKKVAVDNYAPISTDRGMKITLDFTDFPDLLEQIKQKARNDFREVSGQLMYWAGMVCGKKEE